MRAFQESIKTYFDQGKYIFLYNIFERLTFFAFYISIARYVDKDLYGLVVSVSAFTNILASIFDLGLPFYIQRESALGRFSEEDLVNVLFFKFLMIIFSSSLSVIYFWNERGFFFLILLISFINFYQSINQILVFYFYGKEKFKESFYSILITRILLFPLFILSVKFKLDISIVLIIFINVIIFQTYYLLKFGEIKFYNLIGNLNLIKFIKVIRNSLPIGLSLIFIIIYERLDILLLRYFTNYLDVAIYSVSSSIFRNSKIISSSMVLYSYNIFSKEFLNKVKFNFTIIKNELILLNIFSFILILSFNFYGEEIISFLYGESFVSSAIYLASLSFAIPFIFMNNFYGIILNSNNLETKTMLALLCGLILNTTLNILLIPKLKIQGAVISTILTELIVLLFLSYFIFSLTKREK